MRATARRSVSLSAALAKASVSCAGIWIEDRTRDGDVIPVADLAGAMAADVEDALVTCDVGDSDCR
jgi:molybdenum cofactor biosynthesis enzyme